MSSTPPSTAAQDLISRRASKRVAGSPDLTSPDSAYGRCVIESAALVAGLDVEDCAMVSVSGLNYPGRKHSAVVLGGEEEPAEWQVIDLTARQFDATAPVPWEGSLLDWYDACVDWLGDHLYAEFFAPEPGAPQGVSQDPFWSDIYADRDDVEPGVTPMAAAWSALSF